MQQSPHEPPLSAEDEANLLDSYKSTVGKFRERIEAIRGPRGEQAYIIEQISRQLPLESERTSTSDPDQDIHGHIAYFAPRDQDLDFQVHKFPVADIVKCREALCQMDGLWRRELPLRKPEIRWIHLPANNMHWVTVSPKPYLSLPCLILLFRMLCIGFSFILSIPKIWTMENSELL